MKQLSRREFFKRLKFNVAHTTVSAVSVIAPPRKAVVTPTTYEEHEVACVRCCAPFTATGDEGFCPQCREADAKQQSFMAGLFK
jgi:hypothetical protein